MKLCNVKTSLIDCNSFIYNFFVKIAIHMENMTITLYFQNFTLKSGDIEIKMNCNGVFL